MFPVQHDGCSLSLNLPRGLGSGYRITSCNITKYHTPLRMVYLFCARVAFEFVENHVLIKHISDLRQTLSYCMFSIVAGDDRAFK